MDDDARDRLAHLAELEAWKARMAGSIQPDPARLAAGWERRFVTEGTRADEAAALYRELGFEVAVDEVRAGDLADECESCQLVAMLKFRVLYTRR